MQNAHDLYEQLRVMDLERVTTLLSEFTDRSLPVVRAQLSSLSRLNDIPEQLGTDIFRCLGKDFWYAANPDLLAGRSLDLYRDCLASYCRRQLLDPSLPFKDRFILETLYT